MNFDEALNAAWRGEQVPATSVALAVRVRRGQLRHRLLRAFEIALTLIAIAVFGRTMISGESGPQHWLLLPFFAVYLPLAWIFILRTPGRHGFDVTENTRLYARLRMSQLRIGLRDLWLARTAACALLAYAIAAFAGAWLLAAAPWRILAAWLMMFSLVWAVCTLEYARRRRLSLLREYRSMRRVAGA